MAVERDLSHSTEIFGCCQSTNPINVAMPFQSLETLGHNRGINQTSLPINWMVSTEAINMSAHGWADEHCFLL